MPDTGALLLSGVCLLTAVSFVLWPRPLLKLSSMLNRTLGVLDEVFVRYRYTVAVILFVVSYLLFRIALLLPELRA